MTAELGVYTASDAQTGWPVGGDDLGIVQYDRKWPEFYQAERRRIRAFLGPRLASIEHVGSSSISGMAGRREIDILLGVRTMRDAQACVSRLRHLGYTEPSGRERYAGEWRFLTRRGPVLFEMLIVRHRGPYWHHVVRFRDHLRRHPEAARRYERVKLAASLKGRRGDPTVYVEEKRRFQSSVLGAPGQHRVSAASPQETRRSHFAQEAQGEGERTAGTVGGAARPAGRGTMPLELVRLPPLMLRTEGSAEVRIGLIDGPVASSHPDLVGATIRHAGTQPGTCRVPSGAACRHGTSVAGILSARRGSEAPAICPGCTLLTRPIFRDEAGMPTATPDELAAAIVDCLDAGARVLNVSAALLRPSTRDERSLDDILTRARGEGAMVVAAAGNHAMVGSSALTRHPGVIPVVAYDLGRRPMSLSNIGPSIGRRGLGAPGEDVVSLAPAGGVSTSGGTSAAAAFVTAAIALLWSEFPDATQRDLESALHAVVSRRRSIVPPLLDAWAAWLWLSGETSAHTTLGGHGR